MPRAAGVESKNLPEHALPFFVSYSVGMAKAYRFPGRTALLRGSSVVPRPTHSAFLLRARNKNGVSRSFNWWVQAVAKQVNCRLPRLRMDCHGRYRRAAVQHPGAADSGPRLGLGVEPKDCDAPGPADSKRRHQRCYAEHNQTWGTRRGSWIKFCGTVGCCDHLLSGDYRSGHRRPGGSVRAVSNACGYALAQSEG